MGNRVKFGIAAPVPGESVQSLMQFVSNAEAAGFDTVWFPDHIVFMAKRFTPEVWSVVTAASVGTSSIHMGTIGDAHRIHPAVMAQRLATVDHISSGRAFVCLGYGEKMNLDPYGIRWDKPLTRVAEAAQIMRALWSGEPVSFDGEFYKLKDAELRITPEGGVPIYIAATGPKALRIAGQYGDGWVTNAMPARLYADKSRAVDEGAAKRDSKLAPIEKTLFIFVSLAGSQDEAYSSIEPIKHALVWPELLKDSGYDIEVEDQYKGIQYTKIMPNDAEMLRKFKEMGEKYYTRELMLDFIIAGSKEEVVKRLEEYVDAGVGHFILRDFSPDRAHSFKVLSEEVVPYFRS